MMTQTAVLVSAGLDSAVLAASEARSSHVHPIYVSLGHGLGGRGVDRARTSPALAPVRTLAPLAQLTFTCPGSVSPDALALRGEPPAFDTPDEDVYLTGRNIILLTKAAIYCAQHGIARIALGPLADNPFPDATPEFFDSMARALSLGLAQSIRIDAPLAGKHKGEVISFGLDLGIPLELTLSCMNPRDGLHCGLCSKCRERRDGFNEAGAAIRHATRFSRLGRFLLRL